MSQDQQDIFFDLSESPDSGQVDLINWMKREGRISPRAQIEVSPGLRLVPVGPWILEPSNLQLVDSMVRWRKDAAGSFFAQVPPSRSSMLSYLEGMSIGDSRRLLFFVEQNRVPVGHLGLSRVSRHGAEVDNVIKGSSSLRWPGMRWCLGSMAGWARSKLGADLLWLKVKVDNHKAISLYKDCGFHHFPKKSIPLSRGPEPSDMAWMYAELGSADTFTSPVTRELPGL